MRCDAAPFVRMELSVDVVEPRAVWAGAKEEGNMEVVAMAEWTEASKVEEERVAGVRVVAKAVEVAVEVAGRVMVVVRVAVGMVEVREGVQTVRAGVATVRAEVATVKAVAAAVVRGRAAAARARVAGGMDTVEVVTVKGVVVRVGGEGDGRAAYEDDAGGVGDVYVGGTGGVDGVGDVYVGGTGGVGGGNGSLHYDLGRLHSMCYGKTIRNTAVAFPPCSSHMPGNTRPSRLDSCRLYHKHRCAFHHFRIHIHQHPHNI